jgi:hypothetical protein
VAPKAVYERTEASKPEVYMYLNIGNVVPRVIRMVGVPYLDHD